MAHLWLLLRLRARLSLRRYSSRPAVLVLIVLSMVVLAAVSVIIALALRRHHARLDTELSQTLFDLTTIGTFGFLVLSPILGFLGNEFMDVTKLFHYPIRPTWVFVSTVAGNFLSGTTLFLAPILVIPTLRLDAEPSYYATVALTTIAFLFATFAAVQCLTLLLLNVLKSRRFRDLVAILGPVVGLGTYFAMRYLFLGVPGNGGREVQIERMLEGIDLSSAVRFVPPLWYAHAMHGGEAALRGLASLVILGVMLCILGVTLTERAFHGEIAIAPPANNTRARFSLIRPLVSALLPRAASAVYGKELTTLAREPWFRVLFIQQMGFAILISLGRELFEDVSGVENTVLYGAAIIVFMESGFLMNVLGFEGPGIHHTARLPATGFSILVGKNAAYFQLLALTNSIAIPALALLASRLAHTPFPIHTTILAVLLGLVVLPVMLATGNVLSVLLPTRVGRRGRRALGQDRTGNEGCIGTSQRMLFSLLAMIPMAVVGYVCVWPVLNGGTLNSTFYLVSLPTSAVLTATLYLVITHRAAIVFERRRERIVAKLG